MGKLPHHRGLGAAGQSVEARAQVREWLHARNREIESERAQIPDRADNSINIDHYVDDLSDAEKRLILQARNAFLSKLEHFSEDSDVKELIEVGFAVQSVNTSGPAIITTTQAITSVTPRPPYAAIYAVTRR